MVKFAWVVTLVLSGYGLQAQDRGEHWVATWGTAQQLMRGTNLPGGGRATPAAAPAPRPGVPQRRFPIPPELRL